LGLLLLITLKAYTRSFLTYSIIILIFSIEKVSTNEKFLQTQRRSK
jgi:hypothetical protein